MQNDWKMLTLFIGANDSCGVCLGSNPWNESARFQAGIFTVLEKVI